MSPTRPNQMTIGCRAGAAGLCDIRASLRRLRPAGTSRRGTHEAIVRTSFLRREKPELLEPRLDRAQGAAVARGDFRYGVSGLERGDERALFIVGPSTTHVAGKLRASLRACGC